MGNPREIGELTTRHASEIAFATRTSAMADAANLTPEEIMFKKKYGRLPPKKKAAKGPLARIHGGERKFFDSADHAMQAQGVAPPTDEGGNIIANPENIPRRSHSKPSGMADAVVTNENEPVEEGQGDAKQPTGET